MKTIKGIVQKGQQLGSKLGFPTANLDIESQSDVPAGVYAVSVEVDGIRYRGMANIGTRPTVHRNHSRKVLEVNIFDYSKPLYGKQIEVEMLRFVRPEKKFDSLGQLRQAIENDRKYITEYFKNLDTCL